MDRITAVRAGLAAIGIAVWGWGYNHDNDTVRLVGIGALALSFLLRFARRRTPRPPTDASS